VAEIVEMQGKNSLTSATLFPTVKKIAQAEKRSSNRAGSFRELVDGANQQV
jgi:hypothetical protein